MLTGRGFWCFVGLLVAVSVATISGLSSLLLLSVTLLVWFLAQWFLFLVRIRLAVSRVRVRRTILNTAGEARALWASQSALVQGEIYVEKPLDSLFVLAMDRVPPLGEITEGSSFAQGIMHANSPLNWQYKLKPRGPGRLRFEGVRFYFADLQGFFAHVHFQREGRILRVLPSLVVNASHPSLVKQHNALPLLGTHRYARPGTSSELLELRDYLPGDPPRTIAWKASARRDKLLTREFESEVPIRCTLFVDTSDSVRLGTPGRTALARLVEIAAAVGQSNSSERDLTGLCLFDQDRVVLELRPARGGPHLHRLLHELTDIADAIPVGTRHWLPQQLPLAYGLAQDLYFDMLHHEVNAVPWWLPNWAAPPNWTLPIRLPPTRSWLEFLKNYFVRGLAWSTFWLTPGRPWRFSWGFHRQFRQRKQLAAMLSVRYEMGAGGLSRLMEDDDAMGQALSRFLADHQIGVPLPMYDEAGRYLFASPRKFDPLATALLHAIRRAKDNEVFVLMVDALGAGESLERLEKAVRVARGKHHQVVIVQPWPAEVPAPAKKFDAQKMPMPDWEKLSPEEFLLRAAHDRMLQGYELLQTRLTRTGAIVLCAQATDVPDLILQQMQRLRQLSGGGRR